MMSVDGGEDDEGVGVLSRDEQTMVRSEIGSLGRRKALAIGLRSGLREWMRMGEREEPDDELDGDEPQRGHCWRGGLPFGRGGLRS